MREEGEGGRKEREEGGREREREGRERERGGRKGGRERGREPYYLHLMGSVQLCLVHGGGDSHYGKVHIPHSRLLGLFSLWRFWSGVLHWEGEREGGREGERERGGGGEGERERENIE